MNFIDIAKSKIPYELEIALDGETFQFEIYYNSAGDFFTVNLSKDHKRIINGEKLVYGVPLFENLQYLGVPYTFIIPYDITRPRLKHAERITWDNLNEDIFLYVITKDEASEIG